MSHIAQYSPIGSALANNAIKEYGGKTFRDARDLMADSFNSISSNPQTTADEKYLAKLGWAVQGCNMPNEDAAALELDIMRVISNQTSGSMDHVLAVATKSVADQGGIAYPSLTYAVRTAANYAVGLQD